MPRPSTCCASTAPSRTRSAPSGAPITRTPIWSSRRRTASRSIRTPSASRSSGSSPTQACAGSASTTCAIPTRASRSRPASRSRSSPSASGTSRRRSRSSSTRTFCPACRPRRRLRSHSSWRLVRLWTFDMRLHDPENDKSPDHSGLFLCRIDGRFGDSGGRIRTCDLRGMSPTSYQTAPPRGGSKTVARPGLER
jgi:hypothetical protein